MVRFTERSLRSVSGGAKSLRLVSIQLASLALRIALQVSRERRASGTASRFASLTAGCPAPIRCFIACCFPIVHDRIVGIVIRVADAPSLRVRQGSRFCAQRHCFSQGNPTLAFMQLSSEKSSHFLEGLLLLFLPKAERRAKPAALAFATASLTGPQSPALSPE